MSLDDLNSKQREAVLHASGPLMIVAGAGTGKTQVITRRIGHLIDSQLASPSEILALTFTEKAASEMEGRIVELLGYLHGVEVMTFNGFGGSILKRFGRDLGLGSELKLLSEIQQNILISDNLDEFNMDYFAPLGKPDKYVSDMLKYFSKLKNELIKPKQYEEFSAESLTIAIDAADRLEATKNVELARAYEVYISLCRRKGFIDYDDQVCLAIELLEQRPNVAKQLQSEIRWVLVDEFQDTNKSQNRLLELLVGKDKNITVVGDDDQSIYRFRGAAISNILGFKTIFPSAKEIVLTQNYRSSQQILDASYRLIQNNNPERLEFKNNINKHLTGQFRADELTIKSHYDMDLEMNWVAKSIQDLTQSGTKPSDIALLVRKNSQALKFGRVFERVGVPHRVLGQSQDLYGQPEVQYLLYYFRFLANPNDSASLYHLLAGDIFGIDLRILRLLVDSAASRHTSLEQIIRDGEAEGNNPELVELITKFDQWRKHLPDNTVGEIGFTFLEESGYVARLIKQSESSPEVTLKLNHLNHFFKTIHEYESVAEDKTVVGYVDHLGGLMTAGEATDAADVDVMAEEVQIMTVHRAKGLEFDSVFLFDLTMGNFPARNRGGDIEVPVGLIPEAGEDQDWNIREERRLMYVAMTRAKKRLTITFSIDHGGTLVHKPSVFLNEITGSNIPLSGKEPGHALQQLDLFRFRQRESDLTPNFWQGDWLVLTVRQIDDYIKCPAEFRWKHILKVPERVNANLAYGSLLHHIIEMYNRALMARKSLTLEEMLALLRDEWPEVGFFSKGVEERSFAQAERAIRSYYEREQSSVRIPKLVEDSFEAKLNGSKVVMKGRYDAVFEDETVGLEIRDYKSGGAGLSDNDAATKRAKDSNQLTMYALSWQLIHNTMPDALTLDFVDQGLVGSAHKTPKQLERMSEKIAEAASGIRAGNFEPGSSCFNCSHTNLYQ